MARRVRTYFRELPKDVREALAETRDMTSSEALEHLGGTRGVLAQGEFRDLMNKLSRRYKVPIKISAQAFRRYGVEEADAFAAAPRGKYVIYVHPILRYYPEKHIGEVVEHELDHIKVMKRYGQVTE